MRVSYTRNLRSNTDLRIQSVINVLTEAYDYVKLTEAVPYSVAKEYLEIERSPEAEAKIKEVFSKLKSLPNARQLDKRGYRIAFPYAEDSTEFEIQSILEPYNFSIKDYKDGVALDTENNRDISLGKALNIVSKKEPDAKELIDRYAALKGKGATSKDEDLMIIFSSAKYDLAGMSTGRNLPEFGDWDSCMNVIKGSSRRYVKLDIQEGSIICYLTTVSDTNLQRALGRVLIKPYLNTEDKKDVVLYAELKTYGKIPNPDKFMDEVDDYMEKTQKLSGSYERLGCLYGDSTRTEVEAKETIKKRALGKLEDGEGLSKAEFVSLPLKNKRQYIDVIIKEEIRLFSYQYSFASQSQKKEYLKIIMTTSGYLSEFEFKNAPQDSKTYIIKYKIDNELDLEKYVFDEATLEQKQKYVNIRMSNNNRLHDYELKIATPEQKEKYIDVIINTKGELDRAQFSVATEEQKEKYIDTILKLAEDDNNKILKGYEKVAATEKQQLKYLDILIKNNSFWGDELTKYLKGEAKEKYIDYVLDTLKGLNEEELEIATPKQKEKNIDIILSTNQQLREYEFTVATPKQKEKYIDWILRNRYRLRYYEIEAATPEQRERYIDIWIESEENISEYELKYATPQQKEKYYAYAK